MDDVTQGKWLFCVSVLGNSPQPSRRTVRRSSGQYGNVVMLKGFFGKRKGFFGVLDYNEKGISLEYKTLCNVHKYDYFL